MTLAPEQNPPKPRGHELTQIFDPHTVAVVGATDDRGKWGYWLASGALKGAHRRTVYLINRSGRPVCGEPTYPSLDALPTAPQLVALAVPKAAFSDVVDTALGVGAEAILAVSSGFAESGSEGRRQQEDLAARVRDHGAMLVGPNCLGVVDTGTDLELAWTQAGVGGLPAGPAAVVSQSGNVGVEIALSLRGRGVGLSRFASVGNQADLSAVDFLASLVDHEPTRVVVLYLEEFRRPRELLRQITAARDAGKYVVVLAPAGANAARAAASHTGALATDAAIVQAACRDSGALLASSMAEALDLAEYLARAPLPRGRRAAVISDGGGHTVLAADVLESAGIEVVGFSANLQDELKRVLDPTAETRNPVDLAAANTRLDGFERAVETVLAAEEADTLVLSGGLGAFAAFDPSLADAEAASAIRMAEDAARRQVPLLVHSMFADTPVLDGMRQAGALISDNLAAAANALAKISDAVDRPRLRFDPQPRGTDEAVGAGYFGARELLADQGLKFPRAREVTGLAEALAAAEHVGWPVALKAVDLLHKSDAGGVALGIETPHQLSDEFTAMAARTRAKRFSIEAMANSRDGLELIVGARRDQTFGPVLVVGFGGIYAEVFRDTALTLLPAPVDHVERLLSGLRGAALLSGVRGRPPLDVESAARAAHIVGHTLLTHPAITDLEVNPLLVLPSGAMALDARVLSEDPT